MCRRTGLIVAVVFASLVRPQAQDNPQATTGSWRPTIVAQHGMVAAGHPLAAEAGMRILFTSGYPDDALGREGTLEGGMPFLAKPFTHEALGHKVREVLDAPV